MNIVVPPTYPEGCKVVFCGEAPGKDECEQGLGFVGPAGRVLDKIIWASGLSRSEIAVTNVVKRPPDGGYDSEHFQSTFYETIREGRRKSVHPTPELLEWYEVLKRELEQANPRVVVACGNEAMVALCNIRGITKHRGSVLPSTLVKGLKVIPILHPSAILRGAQWQELYISSELVSRKVVPLIGLEKFHYQGWEEHLAPTVEEWSEFIQHVDGPFALDIETRAGSIACVGIDYCSAGLDRAICVPLQTTRGPYFTEPEQEWEFWRGLQWLCQRYPLVGHNVFYDLDWLLDYGMQPSEVHDTMLLWHRYYPELPKSLAFVNMWFNDIPYYKDDGKTWGHAKPDQQLWQYNLKDCVATHRAWRAMYALGRTPQFKRQWQTYLEYTRVCMPLAFEMQTLGMEASHEGVDVARAVLTAELDKVRGKLEILSGGELAVRKGNKKITDQQAVKYLYTTLKLPAKRNRKTKQLSADEDSLVELLIKYPKLEVLKALNAERKIGKALNSYLEVRWEDDGHKQSGSGDRADLHTVQAL